jgi:sulfite exporter TauE/SafE
VQIGPIRRAGKLLSRPGMTAKFGLGTLLGFLPCGLIYAALLKSMSAGSVSAGAANMLVFGLGTAVPLLALGAFSATFLRWFGKHSAPLAATGVTLMGITLIWRGVKPICLMHLQ